MNTYSEKKGFTLLELLIVIAIIAALSTILIIVINPSETLKQSRDSQRIADLSTLKTALGLYMTATSSPQLDGTSGTKNAKCASTVWFSAVGVNATSSITGYTTSTSPTSTATAGAINGTGWVPVNLSSLTGGSPVSNMPLDPVNTFATVGIPTSTDYMYRYACDALPLGFEVNAALESAQYTTVDNKRANDGGNNALYYEVGTDLTILPATTPL
jgi:prepilin-type N-terminal cleavage/methylation domain-containing protein